MKITIGVDRDMFGAVEFWGSVSTRLWQQDRLDRLSAAAERVLGGVYRLAAYWGDETQLRILGVYLTAEEAEAGFERLFRAEDPARWQAVGDFAQRCGTVLIALEHWKEGQKWIEYRK